MGSTDQGSCKNFSVDEEQELLSLIAGLLEACEDCRWHINEIVFDSISILLDLEQDPEEPGSHMSSYLKELLNQAGIRNASLAEKLATADGILFVVMMALRVIAEKGYMTYELVTAVLLQLNLSAQTAGKEEKHWIAMLSDWFAPYGNPSGERKGTGEMALNGQLAGWQPSVRYLSLEGNSLLYLEPVTKLVCLIREFWDVTKGQWSADDFFYLRKMMEHLSLPADQEFSYLDSLQFIAASPTLKALLFAGIPAGSGEIPTAIAAVTIIRSFEKLHQDLSYVGNAMESVARDFDLPMDRGEIDRRLVAAYMKNCYHLRVCGTVKAFDLAVELLYNLKQLTMEGGENPL